MALLSFPGRLDHRHDARPDSLGQLRPCPDYLRQIKRNGRAPYFAPTSAIASGIYWGL